MSSSPTNSPRSGRAAANRELLAQRLRQQAASSRVIYPVSQSQNALLFLRDLAPLSPAYNVAFVARVVSEVDSVALQKALQRVVDRHAALRTTYGEQADGIACQIVHGAMELQLQQVDASSWSEQRLQEEVSKSFAEPYDLSQGPVVRAILFSRSSADHVFLFGMHHIATDGWSMGIILADLQKLYSSYTMNQPCDLAPVGVSYGETVKKRLTMLEGERGHKLQAYWDKMLGGELPILNLPTDYSRPPIPSMQGAAQALSIRAECYGALKALAKAEGVTFYTVVLAAFQVLLMRYSGSTDVLVGTPMAARPEPEFETVVGYFINSVVLRGNLSGNPSFRQLIRRLQDVVLGALSHQDYPFPLLVEKLCRERDSSRSPIFQVMFNLQSSRTLGSFAELLTGGIDSSAMDFAGMKLKPFNLPQGAGQFDLILEMIDSGDRLHGTLLFSTDLFEQATVARMGEHFATLLDRLADHPDQLIGEVQIFPDSEKRQLLDIWNATQMEYPTDVCLHHLVEAQAAKTPDAVAVVFGKQSLTYRELNARADRLADQLRNLGVAPGALVGIYIERSLDMVVGVLGILKAGGAYLPLDPMFPSVRLAFMIADARPIALVTQKELIPGLPPHQSQVVAIDALPSSIASTSNTIQPTVTDLAYVLYTSGSTGKPKGVQISHQAIVNFLMSMRQAPGLTAKDVMVAVTTLSFDIAALELWLPLIAGARVVVVSRETAVDGEQLAKLLKACEATIMQATPATWHLLLESNWQGSDGLKILCGGEAWSQDLANRLLPKCASLWNMYGPTETTVWSAVHRVLPNQPVVIGRPIANTQFYVVDQNLQPVPVGIPGELLIGGDGLARGYLNRPELTAEKFIANPFSKGTSARLYRTGDLVRHRPDGCLEFLSRIDNQVKLRGFRIELGEIESALTSQPSIQEAVVMLREDDGEKRLVGYIVPQGVSEPVTAEIRSYLKEKLPDYMIPASFVVLSDFPRTPNGKIDRKALPAPVPTETQAGSASVEPRDMLERQLMRLWAKVLRMQSVGRTDDFFELGGHSFAAVQLFSEITRLTGKKLPLATLFQAPTLEKLADILRSDGWTPPWSSLVELSASGTKVPLFLFHSHGGNVLEYHPLVRCLGNERPIYALQARGLDGEEVEGLSIEEMAAHYLQQIRMVQPLGPYYLGGFCFGGIVALEAAGQLRAQGEVAALVLLINTDTKSYWSKYQGMSFLRRWASRFGQRCALEWNILTSRPPRQKILHLVARGQRIRDLAQANAEMWLDIWVRRNESTRGHSMAYAREKLALAHDQAWVAHDPKPYSGRVLLVVAERQPWGVKPDPMLGWDGMLAGDVEVFGIPCFRQTLLDDPNVQILASVMNQAMEKCDNPPPSESQSNRVLGELVSDGMTRQGARA